ncbi:MAG: VWA domain-containing protein, partial [Saprospiraceae bacterium]|nr:VWA domain-containing protein [Saprospiraceae bacterium]
LYLFIETLHTGLVPNTGTDFAPALGLALEKLEDNDGTTLEQKSKIIILISDGEDFGEETSSMAAEVEDRGIKLFTLGVGTERGSKIRSRQGFKKDNNGQDVVSKLNPKSLKTLAANTGGQYFEINATNNDISRLINKIGNIEGEVRDSRQVDVSANKYYYFLGFALFLLLFDGLVTLRTIKI